MLILTFARRKSPDFQLDEAVTSQVLFELARQRFWNWLRAWRILIHGRIPHMLFLGRGVKFFNFSNIQMGRFVQIGEGAYLSALGKAPLTIGNNVNIGAYSRIEISRTFHDVGAYIRIGNNVGLGEFAHLGGAGGLEIGDDCIIGAYLKLPSGKSCI